MTQDQGHAPLPAAPVERVIAGRYTVLREIGRGGMGIVWLAEDRMIGRRVAIKELHLPDGVPPAERGVFEERVLREARTAGRLNDPAVVIVYDVLQERNTYIVMELIEAPTLSDVVRNSGPLPQDAVTALAAQLLSALESAHAAGIVHRDVKPSNVMVLPNGRVKLTDFGIAQSLDDPRLTTSGVLIGSPTYMAPERIHGAEADAATDLWALGAVLFYAVEGYSPFERASTAATMHAITTEVPFLTRSQGPLASLIMGLLINTPQARLTATQVRGLLAQAPGLNTGPQTVMYAGRPGYPPPNPTMITTGPQPSHRRTSRTALLVGLVVLLVAGLVGGWFGHQLLTAQTPVVEAANGGVFTYGPEGDIPQFEVSEGYCASADLRKGVSFPSAVECTQSHAIQVFAASKVLEPPPGVKVGYPNRDKLISAGQSWCSLVFASDVVRKDDKSTTLSFVTLIPSQKYWSSRDNEREVVCVLQRRDGQQLTASMVAKN
ncbi:MAG: serine/threonine-protein kinase [Labedaea sp.]